MNILGSIRVILFHLRLMFFFVYGVECFTRLTEMNVDELDSVQIEILSPFNGKMCEHPLLTVNLSKCSIAYTSPHSASFNSPRR